MHFGHPQPLRAQDFQKAWRDRGGQDKTKGKAAIPTLSTSAVGVTSPRAALGSVFDMRLITSECGCLLGMCCHEHRWGFAPTCSARSTCSAINQLLRVPLDSAGLPKRILGRFWTVKITAKKNQRKAYLGKRLRVPL